MTVQTIGSSTALVLPSPSTDAVGSIVQWAQNLSTAAQAIRLIVDTPFMPLSFWPTPKGMSLREWPTPQMRHPRETEEEFIGRREIAIASGGIAVVKGDEVGLTPQAALESIYVVRGKPGMYAEAMEALVRSHGHQLLVEQLDDRICRMRTRRRGEEDWQRFEFSMERARKAGYTKQNPKYDSDPQTMLHSRCRAIASRGTAPEVLKGLRSVDEVLDEPGDDAPPPRTRTVKPAPERPQLAGPLVREAAASVALDRDETHSVDSDADAWDAANLPKEPTGPQPVTDKQWRDIGTMFVKLGVTGPGQTDKRCLIMTKLAGHTVAERGDLTERTAALILDTLAANGRDVVFQLLNPRAAHQSTQPEPAAEPVEPALPVQDPDEIDPTADADWGSDEPGIDE